MVDPLQQRCMHIGTEAEQLRDPAYIACFAQPGAECVWSRRFDGVLDPRFHSERLEAAVAASAPPPEAPDQQELDAEAFDRIVLADGEV